MKIEKDVPLPGRPPRRVYEKGRNEHVLSWVLRKMEAGDSVFIPERNPVDIRSHAHHIFGAGNYAVRMEGKGYRLWRMK